MRPLTRLAVLLASLVAAAGISASNPAPAQTEAPATASGVVVLDLEGVLRRSNAVLSVQRQIDRMRAAAQTEFEALEQTLRQTEQELIRSRADLDDGAFRDRRLAFERSVQDAQARADRRRGELDRIFTGAMDRIRATLLQVVGELARERGAELVIDKADVILSSRALDISEESLAILNTRIPDFSLAAPTPAPDVPDP